MENFEKLKFKVLIFIRNVWVERHIVRRVFGGEIVVRVLVDVDFEDGGI
jgi:hypothetical protein